MPYTKPEGVGYRTDTSHAAARALQPKVGTLKHKILDYMKRHPVPLTTRQIARGVGIDYHTVQPRVTELARNGLIRESAERGTGKLGTPVKKWEVV